MKKIPWNATNYPPSTAPRRPRKEQEARRKKRWKRNIFMRKLGSQVLSQDLSANQGKGVRFIKSPSPITKISKRGGEESSRSTGKSTIKAKRSPIKWRFSSTKVPSRATCFQSKRRSTKQAPERWFPCQFTTGKRGYPPSRVLRGRLKRCSSMQDRKPSIRYIFRKWTFPKNKTWSLASSPPRELTERQRKLKTTFSNLLWSRVTAILPPPLPAMNIRGQEKHISMYSTEAHLILIFQHLI